MTRPRILFASFVALISGYLGTGCERKTAAGPLPPPVPVSIIGSDLMINLVQALSEVAAKNYGAMCDVSGGGSAVGLAALRSGSTDIAAASREITAKERTAIREAHGKDPVAHHIGWDASVVWVHASNAVEEISIPALGEIFAEGGRYDDWSQVSDKKSGEIVSFIRSSCSGIHDGFRTVVMKATPPSKGYRDYRPMRGAIGSRELVDLCAETPGGIGYTSAGWSRNGVKALRVSCDEGDASIAPTRESVADGSYPLTVSFYLYTVGEPDGDVKKFIDFVRSAEGRKVVEDNGMFAADAPTK